MVLFAFSTHIGYVRETQEDAYGHVGNKFFVVADGLGGHAGGEIAANLAVTEAIKIYKSLKGNKNAEDILTEVFQGANRKILTGANKDPNYFGMGTTMVCAIIVGRKWLLGNIGDSRGYFFSGGILKQVTIDHEEPSGALTRAVGLEEEATPDIFSGNFKTSDLDLLLLTTDGLTNFISDQTIQNVLSSESDIKRMATRFVKLSLDAGGLDNVTVCIIAL